VTLVRLHLAHRLNDSAEQFLDEASARVAQLVPAIEVRGWTHYLIELFVLQALVDQEQGNQASSLTALDRALSLAMPERYVRIFVDEGAPMAALLAQVARGASPVAAYAATLLAAFPKRLKAREVGLSDAVPASMLGPQSSALVDPLSERELEVLRLIAEGHSNQAIADTLVVALSTVKRHINNLYGKLAVQSRTQALVRARELHLL
jgi:LuxR family transcriptional regulator, maltose regulon positive regulatory protein